MATVDELTPTCTRDGLAFSSHRSSRVATVILTPSRVRPSSTWAWVPLIHSRHSPRVPAYLVRRRPWMLICAHQRPSLRLKIEPSLLPLRLAMAHAPFLGGTTPPLLFAAVMTFLMLYHLPVSNRVNSRLTSASTALKSPSEASGSRASSK